MVFCGGGNPTISARREAERVDGAKDVSTSERVWKWQSDEGVEGKESPRTKDAATYSPCLRAV